MSTIHGFNGIVYNSKKINLADVIASSYDVIDGLPEGEPDDLSEYNIKRLFKNTPGNDQVTTLTNFHQWHREGLLLTDSEPSVYVLTQTFMLPDGKQMTRKGFIAGCKLDSSLIPEVAPENPPTENLCLTTLRETDALFCPALALYNDSEFSMNEILFNTVTSKPFLEVVFDDVLHRVWKVTDTEVLTAINAFFNEHKYLLFDGFEHYEAVAAYRNSRMATNPAHSGIEPYNFMPIYFLNTHDPGILFFPIHRILHGLPDFDPVALIEELEKDFHVTIYSSQIQLTKNLPLRKNNLGVVFPTSLGYLLLEMKNPNNHSFEGLSSSLMNIDIYVLHHLVLKIIQRLARNHNHTQYTIGYERNIQTAIDHVREKRAQVAFLLNSLPVENLPEIVSKSAIPPRRPGYFFPEIPLGLIAFSYKSV